MNITILNGRIQIHKELFSNGYLYDMETLFVNPVSLFNSYWGCKAAQIMQRLVICT